MPSKGIYQKDLVAGDKLVEQVPTFGEKLSRHIGRRIWKNKTCRRENEDTLYAVVDFGTSKVRTVIAEMDQEGELEILVTGVVPSHGMLKGRVENFLEIKEAIKSSLKVAQQQSSRRIARVFLGVPTRYMSCVNIERPLRKINRNELNLTPPPYVPKDKEALHIIPTGYRLNGQPQNNKVIAESFVLLADLPFLNSLVEVAESCKVSIAGLIANPLATSLAVLNYEDEREGVEVVVDIGGGTTDIIILRDGRPWNISAIPVGGNQMTSDLAVALGIPFILAEEIKLKWGHALPEMISPDEEVMVPGVQGRSGHLVKRRAVCEPLHFRLIELLELVEFQIRKVGLSKLPPKGLVITGGSASIPGLQRLVGSLLYTHAQIGYPDLSGCPAERPDLATAVGQILWATESQSFKPAGIKRDTDSVKFAF